MRLNISYLRFGDDDVNGTRSPFSNLYSPSLNKAAVTGVEVLHIPMDFIKTLN